MGLRAKQVYEVPIKRGGSVHGIPLDRIPQRSDNWCWAACVEMILKFYKLSPGDNEQCAIARKGLRIAYPGFKPDCCKTRSPCNKRLADADITRLWRGNDGYRIPVIPRSVSGPPTPGLIKSFVEALNNGHPIETGYFNGGGGHVLILHGHDQEAPGDKFNFYFRDPDPLSNAEIEMPSDKIFRMHGVLNATWEIRPMRRR